MRTNRKRKAAITLILLGLGLMGANVFQLWQQTTTVIKDPILAKAIDKDWGEKEMAQPKQVKSEVKSLPVYTEGQEVGELIIPKLGLFYPLHWGTSAETLKQGIGMYDSDFTGLPAEFRHTAIAGHRDTSFRQLEKLEHGDRLYIVMDQEKYSYQIRKVWITDAEDQTVIVEKDRPVLTLTTCYPFQFIGLAPDRYIIQAELIDKEEYKKTDFDAI